MTDAPIIEEVVEEPCVDATELVEHETDVDDEPYQEIIILDLHGDADELWFN